MSFQQAQSDETRPAKMPWVHPELVELDIGETAGRPGVGGDGGVHADCSRS